MMSDIVRLKWNC